MRYGRGNSSVGFSIILLVIIVGIFSVSVQAAVLYKSYIVRKAGGQEILCDPYIVQKDDYVLKIFRQRGEISQADFPEFLSIFQSINPQVPDINKILPGQHIFIPLKKLDPGSIPDQDFGVVTIPFVTGAEIDDILKSNSEAYRVRQGDTVSKLLSVNFGRYGTKAYKEGLNIFMAMNPHIKDINFIVTGQEIWLPQKNLQNQPWYESLFDAYGNVAQFEPVEVDSIDTETKTAAKEEGADMRSVDAPAQAPIAQAAQLLDGKLYQKGTYYFPRPGQSDLQLDLTKYPILEIKGSAHVLIAPPADEGKRLSEAELTVFRNFWKDLVVAELPADASLPRVLDSVVDRLGGKANPGKRVFTDGGVQVTVQPRWMIEQPKRGRSLAVTTVEAFQEMTPQPVLDYLEKFGIVLKEVAEESSVDRPLADPGMRVSYGQVPVLDASSNRKTFVRDFFEILGAVYSQNVRVSFPYAGVQIEAVSNLLSRPDGVSVLIDFGDLQGDAVSAIEKTGLKVLQISPNDVTKNLVPDLIAAAGLTCDANPTLLAADRSGPSNTAITVPGFLAQKEGHSQVLLSTVPVHDDLIRFFHEKNIGVATLINMSGG